MDSPITNTAMQQQLWLKCLQNVEKMQIVSSFKSRKHSVPCDWESQTYSTRYIIGAWDPLGIYSVVSADASLVSFPMAISPAASSSPGRVTMPFIAGLSKPAGISLIPHRASGIFSIKWHFLTQTDARDGGKHSTAKSEMILHMRTRQGKWQQLRIL